MNKRVRIRDKSDPEYRLTSEGSNTEMKKMTERSGGVVKFIDYEEQQQSPAIVVLAEPKKEKIQDLYVHGQKVQVYLQEKQLFFESEGLEPVNYSLENQLFSSVIQEIGKLDIQIIDGELKVYGKEMAHTALKIQNAFKNRKKKPAVAKPPEPQQIQQEPQQQPQIQQP